MNGRTTVIIVIAASLFISCASVRYADVQRDLREQKYTAAKQLLAQAGPTDAQGLALQAECCYDLLDYVGQAEASRKALAVSDEFRPRIVRFLRLAYVEQLDKALRVYNAGNDLETVKLLSEVAVFGKLVDKTMDPLIVKVNQRVISFSAFVSIRLKDNPQARAFLDGLCAEWKDRPEHLQQLAFVYYQIGEARRCVETCEMVLARRPDNLEVLRMRAQASEGLGERDVALHAYGDVIEHTPDTRIPQHNLGTLLYYLEDWHEARQHFESAVALSDPDSLDLLRMTAECAYREKDFPAALAYYQRLSRNAPRDGDAQRGMGACLWIMGKKDEAEEAFERARQIAWADSGKRGGVR